MAVGDLKGLRVAVMIRYLDVQNFRNCSQRNLSLVKNIMKRKSEVEEWNGVCVK